MLSPFAKDFVLFFFFSNSIIIQLRLKDLKEKTFVSAIADHATRKKFDLN